jgi:hypothetical protein
MITRGVAITLAIMVCFVSMGVAYAQEYKIYENTEKGI